MQKEMENKVIDEVFAAVIGKLQKGSTSHYLKWSDNVGNKDYYVNEDYYVEVKKAKLAPNVIFLPYYSNKRSCVEVKNEEIVVSGPFSGCYMAAYKRGDKRYVCHIAQDGGNFNKGEDFLVSQLAKLDVETLFDPGCISLATGEDISNIKLGVILPDNTCYSLLISKDLILEGWIQWGITYKKIEIPKKWGEGERENNKLTREAGQVIVSHSGKVKKYTTDEYWTFLKEYSPEAYRDYFKK